MVAQLARYLNFRTLALVLVYALATGLSYFIAYELRFDFAVPSDFALDRINTVWWVVLLKLMLLGASGQLDSLLSYFRLPDAIRLFVGLLAASIVMLSMWYVYEGSGVPPRSVILSDLLLSFLMISAFRIGFRMKSSRELSDWFGDRDAMNVVIVGAGEVGATVCAELINKTGYGMRPVAFVDDNERKVGRYIHGILVADTVEGLARVAQRLSVQKAVIAFPSASMQRVKAVVKVAQEIGLEVDIVPALTDIVSGRARMTQLRPVQLEDLLGRDPVDLN